MTRVEGVCPLCGCGYKIGAPHTCPPKARHRQLVDYATSAMLAASALDQTPTGRHAVDTATREELLGCMSVLAGWLIDITDAAVGRLPGEPPVITTLIDNARAEARHVIATGGHCPGRECNVLWRDVVSSHDQKGA